MPKPKNDGYVMHRLIDGLWELSDEAVETLLNGLAEALENDQKEIARLMTEALRNEQTKKKILGLMRAGKYADAEAVILQQRK